MNVCLTRRLDIVGLSLVLGVHSVFASLAYDPSQWSLNPDQGTIAYVNSGTTLDFVGPTGNSYPSFDFVTYTAPPISGSDGDHWRLVLNWNLNAGASDVVAASFSVPDQNPVTLDSGGQLIGSGSFTFEVLPGQSATVLFETQTGEGKTAPTFDLTLDSISVVPEPATWAWAVLLTAFLGFQSWLARRRRDGSGSHSSP